MFILNSQPGVYTAVARKKAGGKDKTMSETLSQMGGGIQGSRSLLKIGKQIFAPVGNGTDDGDDMFSESVYIYIEYDLVDSVSTKGD